MTSNRYGRLDVAINNAGIVGPTSVPITEYAEDDFLKVMDINVTAVYVAMKHQLRIMQKQQSGVIINMSSIARIRAGPSGLCLYCQQTRSNWHDSRCSKRDGRSRYSR